MLHLVDESSSSREGLNLLKRRSVDVGDGRVQAVDSTRDGHESITAAPESNAYPSFGVPPSTGVVEGAAFPEVEGEVGGSSMEVGDNILRSESSSLVPVDISS